MAYTKIWAVHGGLESVGESIGYAANPKKTTEIVDNATNGAVNSGKTESYSRDELEAMEDIIIRDSLKHKVMSPKAVRKYVSSINCAVVTARDEMVATKKQYAKIDGIQVFHGIQSFVPGEVSPEAAHEIGVKLAEKLWGERFQVVVTTHLDQKHIHNHFIVNSVSFIDGNKFNEDRAFYYGAMRKQSDALCREYGLSVINTDKKREKEAAMHRSAWQAVKDGKPHINSFIKDDVYEVIKESVSFKQFAFKMNKKGYDVKNGKHLAVRPKGRKNFVRLDSWFGDEYSRETINQKILLNYSGYSGFGEAAKEVVLCAEGNIRSQRIVTGIGVLYAGYRYRITSKNAAFIFKEDIRKMDEFSEQQRFIGKHRIKDETDLIRVKSEYTSRLKDLEDARNGLRAGLRRLPDGEMKETLRSRISKITKEMRYVRKNIKTCESIKENTEEMRRKIKAAKMEQEAGKCQDRNRKDIRR